MPYAIRKGSLAGKCGIPFEHEREYVTPHFDRGCEAPSVLEFASGRVVRCGGPVSSREYGRDFFGNLCRCYTLRAQVEGGLIDVWWEDCRWFVRKAVIAREWTR